MGHKAAATLAVLLCAASLQAQVVFDVGSIKENKDLRALLADRFKLKTHSETRQMDGFALRLSGSRLGSNLASSALNCEASFTSSLRCREGGITGNSLRASGAPLSVLIRVLAGQVDAPVSDETNLSGTFDLSLEWSNAIAPSDDVGSILTALQEQLGLKLERRCVTADVVVVEHIEHPAPD